MKTCKIVAMVTDSRPSSVHALDRTDWTPCTCQLAEISFLPRSSTKTQDASLEQPWQIFSGLDRGTTFAEIRHSPAVASYAAASRPSVAVFRAAPPTLAGEKEGTVRKEGAVSGPVGLVGATSSRPAADRSRRDSPTVPRQPPSHAATSLSDPTIVGQKARRWPRPSGVMGRCLPRCPSLGSLEMPARATKRVPAPPISIDSRSCQASRSLFFGF